MIFEDERTLPDEVARVYELRKEEADAHKDWRIEARETFEFRDGEQWSNEDLAVLEERSVPVVTFNRIEPIISSVVGYEQNNRRELKYRPRGLEDGQIAQLYTFTTNYCRDKCDAEDEESEAYRDAVTCGMGWTETRMDYDSDPDGDLIVERVPPLEMRWDPDARKGNLADANWLLRESWWPMAEVKEQWPDADIVPTQLTPTDDEIEAPHDASNAWKYQNDQATWDEQSGRVLVIQFQWRERETVYMVYTPNGMVEFSESRYERIANRLMTPGQKITRWIYKQKMIAGMTVLEESAAPIDGFSFYCITGKRDEKNNIWYGLGRAMLDPQRWTNTFLSQAMFSFQAGSKGGVIVEDGAVEDKRDFEDNWASADGVTYVEDGAISGGRIMPKPHQNYPSGLDKLMSFSITAIRDVTGVNMEALGNVDRAQAAELERERKKSAETILAPLVNALRRYRKAQGKAMLMFLNKYFSPEQIQRLANVQPQFWGNPDVMKYDIIIDDAPSSPNLRTEVWSGLEQIMPAMIKAGISLPPSMIKYTPLPPSVADEWQQHLQQAQEKQSQETQQLQQQLQQLQGFMQQLQNENVQLKSQMKAKEGELALKSRQQELDMMLAQRREKSQTMLKQMELIARGTDHEQDRQIEMEKAQLQYRQEMDRMDKQIQGMIEQAEINQETQLQVAGMREVSNVRH